ncbi:MAG TPA: S-layer homology domain-containing protein [Clostridiales bacterium]|nr:S-layer homology domain-containing protein [Clostridiales bacterium]
MKKRTTRCLALLLAVVMVLSVMPVAMAEETAQTQTYTKVTKAPADWSGTYLIVSEGDKLIMDGSLDKLDVEGNKVDVTITDSKITGDYAKYAFTVEPMTGGYAIKSASGKYISGKSGSNKLNSGSTQSLNTIELTSGKVIVTSDGTTLQYNNAAKNGTRFRYYKSQNQQPISLYKIETAAKQQVETPTANVADGAEIEVGTEIKFECKTEGATIYYKTAGTEYQAYTGPISASHNETYTVKATKDGMEDSKELVVSVDVFEWVNKYVKADTIATGDQVVIYNAGNGYAVAGEMLGSYYLKPAAATVAENALTADSFDKLVWTVTKNEDGTYSFKQGTDTTLTMGTNNGKFNLNLTGDGAVKWDVETCNAENASYYMSGNGLTGQYGKVYMEYYAKYTEFSAYCTSTDRLTEKDFGMTFYKLTREKNFIGGLVPPPTPTQKVATPTASLAAGEVAKGTEVTFSCETEGATILYATDGTTFTEGTTATVNEDVTFTVKATKAGMDDSDEATFTYTVRKEDGEDKLGKLTSADQLTDGSYVMIVSTGYAPLELSGKWLTVVQPTVAEDKVTKTEGAVWTLKVSGQSVTLTDKNGMAIAPSGGNSNGIQSGNYSWAWSFSAENQTFKFMGAGDDTVTLASNTSTDSTYGGFNKFKAYKNNTVASQQYPCEFTLYRVDPASADQPSGDLPKPGDKFVIYNQNAQAVLAAENDSKSIEKAAATVADGKATPANGAVVFTVEQNGEYLRFKSEAYGYLCSNGTGNNAFYSKDFSEEGVTTDDADWLVRECSGGVGGYEMESRTAKFNNRYSQWLEYYSDSFKTYSMDKSKVTDYTIYSFFFYPVADGVNVDGGLVVQPTITFPETMLPAYVGSNYKFDLEIDTIYAIYNPWIEYSVRDEKGNLVDGVTSSTDVEVLGDFTTGKGTAHITVWDTQIAKAAENGSKMTLTFAFKDVKDNEARASCTVDILDEPVISNVTPAQGAQTGTEKRPEISAEISNAGENASVTMTVNSEKVDAVYANGKVTYTPAADMADGKVTVTVTVKRADEKETSKTWSFTIGEATFQRYFGQLHSHTQYSDGAGSLESALAYIKALPDNANVDFVAFTDHSNYFDSKNNPNVEAALYDTSLVKDSDPSHSWATYKNTVAAFNAANAGKMVAIAGFEMTWSGGPGHINTFNTPGIVSRNNTTLNNKTKDAGLQAYYKLLSQTEGANSISQFNHPGTTFGNFIDFGYWDAVVDTRMYMVEVGNGEGQIGAGGYYPSYEQYIMALDKGWHVAPTNNQDNHKGRWGNANDARDVILTDDFTEDGIYAALRARRMYATEDKNLDLDYTVNGNMMGSIIDVPEKLNFEISFNDPDRTDSIAKVELVVNSGKVAYTWDSAADLAKGSVSVELAPEYTYYFVRVTEGDGDLAVTAPVWVGESLKLGISKAECGTSTPVTDEELTITTTFFNSEAKPATIKSITYAIGGETIGTVTDPIALAASSTQDVEFKYTPTKARIMTVKITAVIEQDGKEYTFTKDVTLDVLDASKLVYIGIDASHYNEYVAGNYKDSMGNFGELAAAYSVRTVTLKTSEELIAACGNSKYKAIILTAPSRRLEAAQKDPKTYSEDELNALKTFNDNGGMVILAGWSDNYENYPIIQNNPDIKHMAATQNEVLAKLGSSLRISDDATYDDVRSAADGVDKWRLYFSSYNMENPLLKGVEFDEEHPFDKLYTERFSHYGGASIYAVDASGNATSTLPATVSPAVYGHATTYSVDVDKDGLGGAATPKYTFAENDDRLMVMASEQIEGKGLIIVSGAAFMSNFEVQYQVSDSGAEKNYSNYKICQNLVSMLNQTEITKIADVQAEKDEGVKFTVEGIVTSNASGYDKNTAFFDCIYVQDETAGINAFPVAGEFKIGDKVRISGWTSSYQGERQIKVTSIEKRGEETPVEPKKVTAADLENKGYLGSLVTVEGTATKIEYSNGLIQTIMVRDDTGKEARIFIDGYITTDKDVENAAVGCHVVATGLASYDDTFTLEDGTAIPQRIRIRNRADVVCTAGETPVKTWNITYVTDGGTIGGLYPVTYTEGTVTVLPTDVTKPGYTFLGWFTAYTGGVQVRQIEATETGDKTFYARWHKTVLPPPPVTPGTPVTPARPAAPVGLPFADVSGSDWFYNDVRYVYEKGIMDGTGADRFSPNAPLTRAMIVTILYRMAGSPSVSGSSDFTDVAAGKWFAKAVAWAAANGIVNGYGSGLFGPNDPVTREQLAAILYRYAVYGGMTAVTLEENLGSFADTAQLSAYAIQAMNWAVGQGLINGSGSNLVPKAQATRAQVAAIIHRYLER